jgi:hypothetical protein
MILFVMVHSHLLMLLLLATRCIYTNIRSGRVDALDPSAVTPDGRLPAADSGPPGADPSDAAHLRTIFNRMGFDDQEIVALSGAHALGRW